MSVDKSDWERFTSSYQPPNEDLLINDLAIRCFRDVGDADYIAARLCLKAGLATQAIWSGLQAIEKYLKCMLLLGRVSSNSVGHKITKGLTLVNEDLGFDIVLPEHEQAVFDHLAGSEGDRYLVASLYLFHHELPGLDALVWRLRQYCAVLDIEHYNGPRCKKVLVRNLEKLRGRVRGNPAGGYLEGGYLEKVLSNERLGAHQGLVWRNAMFGGNQPFDTESGEFNFVASNSPLYLNPQIAEAISKLIYLPGGSLKAFQELAAERAKV